MSRRAGDHNRISSAGDTPHKLNEADMKAGLGINKRPFGGIGWVALVVLAGLATWMLLTRRS